MILNKFASAQNKMLSECGWFPTSIKSINGGHEDSLKTLKVGKPMTVAPPKFNWWLL